MPATHRGIARAGLIAKGALYALLALLALQIALGNGADADSQGALREVASRPFGTAMLVVLGLGFTGYAGWQVRCVVKGEEWLPRLTAGARAVVWGALALSAAKFVVSAGQRANPEQSITARVLTHPLGPWLVGAAGVAVAVVGLLQLRHLRGRDYLDDLKPMPATNRRLVSGFAIVGTGAKAGVFCLAGAFLVRAALNHKAMGGVGLDGALSTVARQPYGTYVLVAVAVGLAAYAAWCWVRARYENVEQSAG